MNSFYTVSELKNIGFKHLGENVLLSRKASIYGASNISIGDNVRIDDFCILSGKISIGSFIHISAAAMLFGGEHGIQIEDFVTISSRVAIYAESDDYSGFAMTNPMLPNSYRNVYGGHVLLHKHVIIGSGSTVLPDVILGEGVSIGAMSLVKNSLQEWSMYAGIPCKKIKERQKRILELEKNFMNNNQNLKENYYEQ